MKGVETAGRQTRLPLRGIHQSTFFGQFSLSSLECSGRHVLICQRIAEPSRTCMRWKIAQRGLYLNLIQPLAPCVCVGLPTSICCLTASFWNS